VLGNFSLSFGSIVTLNITRVDSGGSIIATECINISGDLIINLDSIPQNNTQIVLTTSLQNCTQGNFTSINIIFSKSIANCNHVTAITQSNNRAYSLLFISDTSACSNDNKIITAVTVSVGGFLLLFVVIIVAGLAFFAYRKSKGKRFLHKKFRKDDSQML